MKIKTKQITVTAIMLAICLVSQFFKNLSVYITGPIINAALILTVLYAGMACGIILMVFMPTISTFAATGISTQDISPCGGYPCDVSMYHDRKYHSRGMCGTASQKMRQSCRFSCINCNRCHTKGSFHGNSHCSYHSTCISACSNAQDAAGITASVFSDTAYHRCYRRCICSHNCGCA